MFPGLEEVPKNCWFSRARPSRVSRAARPSSPWIELVSEVCSPLASLSTVIRFRLLASTRQGWSFRLLNAPAVNISSVATARPSLRRYVLPDCLLLYCHLAPALASRSTETVKRSSSLRVRSGPSTVEGHDARSCSTRGRPPTSKCCPFPCSGMDAKSGAKSLWRRSISEALASQHGRYPL